MGTAARGASSGTGQSRLRLHADTIEEESLQWPSADVVLLPPQVPIDEVEIQSLLESARRAQCNWSASSVRSRMKLFRKLRLRIAAEPIILARTVHRTDVTETLAAEVLPLLDACRYLEENAARILQEQTVGSRGRPMWLWGNSVVLRQEPLGVVLVIAPSNYPLMLPGIQALQALAAGNAVLIKPAEGCSAVAEFLAELALSVGLPAGVLQVLPESAEAATLAIKNGVNKVVLTGSASTGKAVREQLVDSGTPAVMELSGCDAVFVLDDADLNLVADCLVFGLTLNRGQTCMAPRRVFASHNQVDRLLSLLKVKLTAACNAASLNGESGQSQTRETVDRHHSIVMPMIRDAVALGATVAFGSKLRNGEVDLLRPVVLDRVTPEMSVAQSDLFAPVMSLLRVDSEAEMLRQNLKCRYALGATVFGSSDRCQQFARSIPAGCVVINDMIAPTADPRVPFGGRGVSGYGVTRGAKGLLEMTQLKAVVKSRSWFKPHLRQKTAADAAVLENLIRLEHAANPLQKLMLVPRMVRATIEQIKLRRNH